MHAVLLQLDGSTSKSVTNSAAGSKQLQTWLRNRKAERVHACLEATGGWSEDLALALCDAGHVVSLVTQCASKHSPRARCCGQRLTASTRRSLRRFCRTHAPDPWTPPAPEILALQGLIRRYQSLVQMRTEEQNRLQAPMVSPVVKASIEATLSHLDHEVEPVEREIHQLFDDYPPLRRQRELLTSIPGIGETTAARILGEMPNIAESRNVKAVAAYAGLSPRHYESGSIRRPSRIAKTGNGNLRTALYFPAISAMRFNPLLRRFADRLRERRKSNMVIITAVMRKLLILAYAVLKSGKLFDPTYASP